MSNLEFNKTVDLHEVKTYFHHFFIFQFGYYSAKQVDNTEMYIFLNLGIQKFISLKHKKFLDGNTENV